MLPFQWMSTRIGILSSHRSSIGEAEEAADARLPLLLNDFVSSSEWVSECVCSSLKAKSIEHVLSIAQVATHESTCEHPLSMVEHSSSSESYTFAPSHMRGRQSVVLTLFTHMTPIRHLDGPQFGRESELRKHMLPTCLSLCKVVLLIAISCTLQANTEACRCLVQPFPSPDLISGHSGTNTERLAD